MNDLNEIKVDEVQTSEAPLSIHIDAYYKGFHSGITVRSMDNSVIPANKIVQVINSLISSGFQPSWNVETSKAHLSPEMAVDHPQAQSEPCPKCGSPLVEATKKDGSKYKKCSTNKWDKFKKIATGCDYIDWGNES